MSEKLEAVRLSRLRRTNSIIDALIKMMLIDEHIRPQEFEKIKEIYFLLMGEAISDEDLENRVLNIDDEEETEVISEVGDVIAKSIKEDNAKIVATEALVEVMFADHEKAPEEFELLEKISELWGTEEVLKKELSKYSSK